MSTTGDAIPARGGAAAYEGVILWEYSPDLDRDADPGEIVWTWVPYEDQPQVGKDRPVAVLGRTPDGRLAAAMLSSRNHDGDARWIGIGAGAWDAEGRPSWVRRDRVLAVSAAAVRREGSVLPRATYDAIRMAMGANEANVAGGASAGPVRGLRARLRRLVGRS